MTKPQRIGLSLSGGGARAIAFHLGCLRALNDRHILDRVSVLSSVSGGSVIAAMYAYSDEAFDAFDQRVVAMLRRGFAWGIVRYTFFSLETPKILGSILTAGVLANAGVILSWAAALAGALGVNAKAVERFSRMVQAPLRRRASRSTAFEQYLRELFGDARLDAVKRHNLATVINAAELRTGTAFRFGSGASGSWRFGEIDGAPPRVSYAVAASAAYPILLPALDDAFEFRKNGNVSRKRVILTDGGVYDNLGITCLLPGRDSAYSTNTFDVDFIICCDAGQGQPTGANIPYTWASRIAGTFATTHRRTHSMSYSLLHRLAASGEIAGFLLPYLGQIDAKVPNAPADLVPREAVFDYPTDFNPMSVSDIDKISRRGEQLTHALIDLYHPGL